jgi:hypothetical protein
MIELNCSYEESEKIKELGYDFTSICRDFELHEEGKITKFVLVERHDCGLVDLWDCDDQEARGYSPESWWITPIIPKAALEACLPRTLNFQNHLGDLSLSSFAKRFFCEVIDLYSVMETGVTHHWFTSAFEAFLWCHENYPAELKAKFDEVMA